MGSDEVVDFEVIENSKENIQALPSGRSAKALAQLYTPPLSGAKNAPSPLQLQDAHSAARQEFEKELGTLDESDDPLDVYDRYVKWTLDTYPSAQNTPQSQLCPLLERATKAFQGSTIYKNDPRYLKLWLHYIRFFSDTPRETFAYLSRHNIGEGLALFYEEFAAWLETAGRWSQAEEIYALGIEREARPVERLIRKYGEFQHRRESLPEGTEEPTSPALPKVRAALAAKADPFGHPSATPPAPQAQQPAGLGGGRTTKSGKPKLAIFSDGDEPPKLGSSSSSKGWDSIGTLADRKKENTTEARPWAGETLKVGKKNTGVQKMMIFKDETESHSHDEDFKPHPMREYQQALNPRTGRMEVVFTDLRLVYPDFDDPMAVEFSFEELRARHRGWMNYDWNALRKEKQRAAKKQAEIHSPAVHPDSRPAPLAERDHIEQQHKPQTVPLKGMEDDVENDENVPPSQVEVEKARLAKKARREERANRTRKIKVMDVREIRGEDQTVRTNLNSPNRPKIKRKKNAGAEPTMTINTKEAMDDIYEIFNQPLKNPGADVQQSDSGSESSDDDAYTSAGESTGTGRISYANSDFGDETTQGDFTLRTTVDDDTTRDISDMDDTDVKSVSEWSEFTESKHIPQDHRSDDEDEPDSSDEEASEQGSEPGEPHRSEAEDEDEHEYLTTPTSPNPPAQATAPGRYVPIPPEDYQVPTQPYRDAFQAANNRLPFMTPIVEKTESSIAMTARTQKEFCTAKTPSRSKGTPAILEDDDEPWSSPFRDVLEKAMEGPGKVTQLALRGSKKPLEAEPESKEPAPLKKEPELKDVKPKGPIIEDAQCNPVDESIRELILNQIQPPLTSYTGYFEDKTKYCSKGAEIRKFTKALGKSGRASNDKTSGTLSGTPVLKFDGTDRKYTIKRELGKGAFAPVYLVGSASKRLIVEDDEPVRMGEGDFGIKRRSLEAVKMEDPPSAWEFYIMTQAKRRLGVSRASESVIQAYEMHMFKDECYLVEEYRDQGTLLDLVNIHRAENGGSMDELLAMFFSVELFRTVEALHSKGLIHGDLKADNILVRLNPLAQGEHWDSQYNRDGRDGWSHKGVALIDFGRGIDMKVFKPDVQFIADWKTTEQDCAEMRELRPWTFQVDYHGLAGIIHNLLFGEYISTLAERGATLGAGATKTYRIKNSLKRYWQQDIWSEVFDLLLNPLMHLDGEEGRKLPVLKGMKAAREKMEEHLEENCKKNFGLKELVRRMEDAVNHKRR